MSEYETRHILFHIATSKLNNRSYNDPHLMFSQLKDCVFMSYTRFCCLFVITTLNVLRKWYRRVMLILLHQFEGITVFSMLILQHVLVSEFADTK